ncbi:hypothetical protein GN244_ATG20302 [Phytophthora infestans]|uniref:Uncharacterized protein n=1 Tax=Phytophthora infestans TaxID=4787 RepID=A0A833SJR8_PHYIN|nr:hypothetical protein GN244_ATG20302 [Phytophthora infestans]
MTLVSNYVRIGSLSTVITVESLCILSRWQVQNILVAMAPLVDHVSDTSHVKDSLTLAESQYCLHLNGAVADLLQVSMVGCASHRLSLLLSGDDELITKIQKLMYKVKNSLLVSAKLRRKHFFFDQLVIDVFAEQMRLSWKDATSRPLTRFIAQKPEVASRRRDRQESSLRASFPGRRSSIESSETAALGKDFAAIALEQARRLRQTSRFSDQVSMIAPTSNISGEGSGWHAPPSHDSTASQEYPLLKVNRMYWSAATVRKVVRGAIIS